MDNQNLHLEDITQYTSLWSRFTGNVVMSNNQLSNLAGFISNDNIMASVANMFKDKSEWIFNVTFFPFSLKPFLQHTGDVYLKYMSLGNVYYDDHSIYPLPCYKIAWSIADKLIFLGDYTFNRYFDNFADFNGYTKIKVWLPFYGYVDLEPNDVMGRTISFYVKINFSSGEITYYITGSTNRIIATHTCVVGIQIPITNTNANDIARNLITGGISVAAGVIAGMATENPAVGMAVGSEVKTATTRIVTTTKRNPKTGRQITTGTETISTEKDKTNYVNKSSELDVFGSSIDALNQFNITSKSTGTISSLMLSNAPRNIHIIIYRPKLETVDFNKYRFLYGVPCGKIKKLNSVTGYTEISSIHLEGEGFGQATEGELAQIAQELSQGVIL